MLQTVATYAKLSAMNMKHKIAPACLDNTLDRAIDK